MNRRAILAFCLVTAACGCGPGDDGFRFDGEYAAPKSGYAIRLASAGYVREDGSGVEAFAIVQVCPAGSPGGGPVRMMFTASGGGTVKVECSGLGPVAMDWTPQTAEGMLRGLLASAGFRRIDPPELAASLDAVDRALGLPPEAGGATPAGLRTVREERKEGQPIDRGQPAAEWLAQSEVPECR